MQSLAEMKEITEALPLEFNGILLDKGALFPPPPFPVGLWPDTGGLQWTPPDSTGLTGPSYSDNKGKGRAGE